MDCREKLISTIDSEFLDSGGAFVAAISDEQVYDLLKRVTLCDKVRWICQDIIHWWRSKVSFSTETTKGG